jgi:hypothetical protein
MSELPRSAFRFDPELVRAFVQDRLDDAGRATLADEVARMLPFHLQLPNPVIAELVAVTGHLGGEEALLPWSNGAPAIRTRTPSPGTWYRTRTRAHWRAWAS